MVLVRRLAALVIALLALRQTAAAAVTFRAASEPPADPNTIVVSVSLESDGGQPVGSMQTDILFDTRNVSLASVAACTIHPAIGTGAPGCDEDPVSGPCKTLNRSLASCATSPAPPGCEGQGPDISRFRALIAATAILNANPIPTGSPLFTCTFQRLVTAMPTVQFQFASTV